MKDFFDLLLNGNESYYAAQIEDALSGTEDDLKAYFVSNELWGGPGSIADQALIETRESRRNIENILAELGELEMKHGIVNVRTEMWTTTFREWQKQGR